MSDLRALTLRLTNDEYETLRGYAFTTHQSMNDVARRALVHYLTGEGRREQFESLLDEARSTYRVVLDKLADA